MTPRTKTAPRRASQLARFGPLAIILVALGLVAVVVSTGDGGGAPTKLKPSTAGSTNGDLPITWGEAKAAGTTEQIKWGSKCDQKTGRAAVPSNYAPPCVVARPGVTAPLPTEGVTATTITVVAYELADDDLSASLQSLLDSKDAQRNTRTKLIELLERRYEMWGRKIKIVYFKGTGSDETSARADAVTVATEIGAFASLGGPGQQGAYAEELASRGVICIGCGLALPDSAVQDNAPYLWGSSMTPEQFLPILGDYTIGRLLNRKAKFAGDPEAQTKTRKFGSVNFEQDPPVFTATASAAAKQGEAAGYKPAIRLTYQLVIAELPEKARSLISQLKQAGVTTVVFLGDPIMPIYLTQAATDQDYFPEWVITGTVLTDTTVFGRLYDQKQWAHAFGISPLPVRLPQDQGEAWRLHQWFYGEPPAAALTVGVLYGPIQVLMLGIHQAGRNLSAETFRDGLFSYPVSGGNPTSPQISFGDHGIFAAPDYLTVDDMTEVWWDAKAKGPDEQGKMGTGMMRYIDGGKRYKIGEIPNAPAKLFVKKGSTTMLDEPPAADAPPDYPSPAPGGG